MLCLHVLVDYLLNVYTSIFLAHTSISVNCLLNLQGPPDQVFHLEADPKDPTAIAICTEYNAQIYYLEPADDDTYSIIAVPKDRQKHTFPFKFPVD